MHKARNQHSMTTARNRLYMIGGWCDQAFCYDIEYLDLKSPKSAPILVPMKKWKIYDLEPLHMCVARLNDQ